MRADAGLGTPSAQKTPKKLQNRATKAQKRTIQAGEMPKTGPTDPADSKNLDSGRKTFA